MAWCQKSYPSFCRECVLDVVSALDYLPYFHRNMWGCKSYTSPFKFRWSGGYIYNSSYYHQIRSINFYHCCHIFLVVVSLKWLFHLSPVVPFSQLSFVQCMGFYLFSIPISVKDGCENICTLSYYRHQIGSVTHLPLFMDRSGMPCMSFLLQSH